MADSTNRNFPAPQVVTEKGLRSMPQSAHLRPVGGPVGSGYTNHRTRRRRLTPSLRHLTYVACSLPRTRNIFEGDPIYDDVHVGRTPPGPKRPGGAALLRSRHPIGVDL